MLGLPLITEDLGGTGGVLRSQPEDFVVTERPAYPPSGRGEHVFVTIEKTGLSTFEAVKRMAAALGVRESDVGTAGLKDRHAITRQCLSFPRPVTPEAALALSLPDLRVLSALRHEHKLKTGHLRGNHFQLRVRGLAVDADLAASRAEAILGRLAQAPGTPNWYGEQRFGSFGDNAARGRALLGGGSGARGGNPREKRLLLSAYQSELFNRYLSRRIRDGLYRTVIPGDILRKVETGGQFETTDPTVDQPRLDGGEIVPTGPMFGPEMRRPSADTAAAQAEEAILAEDQLTWEAWPRRLAEGTRRPIAVPLKETSVRVVDASVIEITFCLPAGSYATAIAHEVMKLSSENVKQALLD
jgi:tRNA pseudouridine13 synthase